jgi:arginine decarboxylase
MTILGRLPLLVVNDRGDGSTVDAETLRGVLDELDALGVHRLVAGGIDDARSLFHAHPEVGGILIVWDHGPDVAVSDAVSSFVQDVRDVNDSVPVFLMTRQLSVDEIPPALHELLTGSLWSGEDDADFLAAHISSAMAAYRQLILPPFFGRLVEYVEQARYSWHTPGHMGGVAFLRSPAGRIFHDFFGENVLRADLSSSVPELGSVLEHDGVVADAERAAARTFGANDTYFVTNGTTMSNQIIFRATVSAGDVVLLDRNCHKSIVNSVIQTGAIPIYLTPLRNQHGMIGPVDPTQLDPHVVQKKLRDHPLIGDPSRTIRLAVITNSTYDGTMYDIERLIGSLGDQVEHILLDEAWIPYAPFHPIYAGRFAMSHVGGDDSPTVFASTSTHKMLAAFSQASMIHVRQGRIPVPRPRFNEAFMMHSSTSPQYNIIASLDVATKMMEGAGGRALMSETIQEALDFRAEIQRFGDDRQNADDWWFTPWQPTNQLDAEPSQWLMTDAWTGFDGLQPGYTMLDPTKVSLLCPGIDETGGPTRAGVPAALVAALLRQRGVVVEKTGFYSILVLFSIGVTRGKSATLLEQLLTVKRLIDENAPLSETMPDLLSQHGERYAGLGLRDLADQMHDQLRTSDTGLMQEAIYRHLPPPVMTPAEAFDALIRNNVESVPVEKLDGRVSAVLCVLYPPGIPVVMPGERFTVDVHPIVEYLQLFEAWDAAFPGFETEMQGVAKHREVDGSVSYSVPCIRD